jgi:cold shock CspA family protein
MSRRGIVLVFNMQKGHGLVTDPQRRDLLVFERTADEPVLSKRSRVTFELEQREDGKVRAVNVQLDSRHAKRRSSGPPSGPRSKTSIRDSITSSTRLKI